MPGRDKTGPLGERPMTGKKGGFCSGAGLSGQRRFLRRRQGRSFGRGCGFGFRWAEPEDMDTSQIEVDALLKKKLNASASFFSPHCYMI
ncbi:MAG: DUF5320 domain-containing protein [bacterium]|nr:DUF5320 domain-containing protein [bacterium]